MRDELRLINATMENRESLLKRLRCAVAMLDASGTDECLSYVEEPDKHPFTDENRLRPENHAKALTILSEIRYEINHFRDNVWEGIVHARNRFAHASVVVGIALYALLGLAIFANAPNKMIIWDVRPGSGVQGTLCYPLPNHRSIDVQTDAAPSSYSSASAATSSRQKFGMSGTTRPQTEWRGVEKRRITSP